VYAYTNAFLRSYTLIGPAPSRSCAPKRNQTPQDLAYARGELHKRRKLSIREETFSAVR